MKAIVAAAVGIPVAALAILLGVVVVFANGGEATAPYACGDTAVILATIRHLESGDDYQAQARGATASGAYQYIDVTWRYWADRVGVDTTIYPQAWMAEPLLQDQVAAANVAEILATHDNNVEVIPVVWYYPAALADPALMDRVPYPAAGNILTVREYQTRWLQEYQSRVRGDAIVECTGVVAGIWAFPLPVGAVPASALDDPHHDYPAIDLLVPESTPIFAITGGTVVSIQTFAGNWWTDGCNTNHAPVGCSTCGTGLTIQTPEGLRHTYCHARRLYVTRGDQIAPANTSPTPATPAAPVPPTSTSSSALTASSCAPSRCSRRSRRVLDDSECGGGCGVHQLDRLSCRSELHHPDRIAIHQIGDPRRETFGSCPVVASGAHGTVARRADRGHLRALRGRLRWIARSWCSTDVPGVRHRSSLAATLRTWRAVRVRRRSEGSRSSPSHPCPTDVRSFDIRFWM